MTETAPIDETHEASVAARLWIRCEVLEIRRRLDVAGWGAGIITGEDLVPESATLKS